MVSGASGAARSQKAQSWKRPNTIGTRERAWQKRRKAGRNMQRRTRRSVSTLGGAAPDTIIRRATADRAGARPYRATRCENASPETPIRQYADTLPLPAAHFECNDVTIRCETVHQGFFAELLSIRPRRGSNPRPLCLTNVYFGQQRETIFSATFFAQLSEELSTAY